MRIATYNVEWFNSLFDDDGALLMDGGWSGRHNVTREQQTLALGAVFTALKADAVMIIEAPDENRKRHAVPALQAFAKAFDLRTSEAIVGFHNDTQQEIALLYDPYVMTVRHDPRGEVSGKKGAHNSPRFDSTFRIDLDVDAKEDLVQFSKPPLELEVQTAKGGALRLIGAHLKSKAPHGARNDAEAMTLSVSNRRKQLAQAIWLRQRIEEHLDAGENLILLGDLNDGPGLDQYEDLFGRSSVEIIMGETGKNCLFDPHARQGLRRRLGPVPTSARFYLKGKKRYLQALLDYIMISPGLVEKAQGWHIWNPFEDPKLYKVPALREALLTASDHFPVTLDIDV
ncbi:endonuclease/exonuclease/phosphatase family protein [Lentibacter algarum]|uniref:endonuclease/exonuclease/phosphatase family protein n=1 Tax=Lentibacter algarum TaxID=576131 RepID=UPI001C0650F8|nr:endonuclease/exonuclease/phosphatase family protein [Lentibacter algarum]MBU2980720.1 endonuclease/exonuclease/phosphatase family protein [Lentibacter algarum]